MIGKEQVDEYQGKGQVNFQRKLMGDDKPPTPTGAGARVREARKGERERE